MARTIGITNASLTTLRPIRRRKRFGGSDAGSEIMPLSAKTITAHPDDQACHLRRVRAAPRRHGGLRPLYRPRRGLHRLVRHKTTTFEIHLVWSTPGRSGAIRRTGYPWSASSVSPFNSRASSVSGSSACSPSTTDDE